MFNKVLITLGLILSFAFSSIAHVLNITTVLFTSWHSLWSTHFCFSWIEMKTKDVGQRPIVAVKKMILIK